MKSNKSYILRSLMSQMVIVPIIFTVVLFAVSMMPALFQSIQSVLDPGKSAEKLIMLLAAFFGSLVVGGVVGFVFAVRLKSEQFSFKTKYLTAIIPIIYALVFAVLALIFSKGNYNSGWWGIYALKNPIFIVFDFLIMFSGLHFIMPIAEIVGYTGFLSGIIIHEYLHKTEVLVKTTKSQKVVLAAVCLAVTAFSVVSTRDVVDNGVLELIYGKSSVGNELTEVEIIRIAPFKENNGLARLEKEASLKFTAYDEMPRLDGATAAYPVYAAFVQAVYKGLGDYYEANKNNPEKNVDSAFVSSETYPLDIIKCSKTNEAYERLIKGDTDIIFVAEPSQSQVESIKAKGDEFVLTQIGSEAFIFFTNIKNPVDSLTIKQIQDIYSGSIRNWKEVGGQNKLILPYQRPKNSGSQTIMENRVMRSIGMLEPTKETYAGGMGDIISQVASYKNAQNSIGYSFLYYASSMMKNNQIKYIAVDGIKPMPETVRNKSYPFTVPVYAVTKKSNNNKNVNLLIDWILSDEGQSLVEKTGYIPVR